MTENVLQIPSNETRGNIEVGKHYEIKDQKVKSELFAKYKNYANFMKPGELADLSVDELKIIAKVDLWQRDPDLVSIGVHGKNQQLSCEVKVIGTSQKYPKSSGMIVEYSYKDFADLVGITR